MKKEKIGFFGGCFNPPKKIQIELAKKIIEDKIIDKVIFIPVGDYYDKKDLASAKDRYNMTKLACKNYKNIYVDDIACSHIEKLYAADTFKLICEKYQNEDIYFIMGSDNFEKMPLWKDYNELINKYKFIVIERFAHNINTKLKNVIYYKTNQKSDISSTLIRNMLHQNKPTEEYLDNDVIEYIKTYNIFNVNSNIIEESNRCLNCKKPMCKQGCPIETNIPEFIQEIKQNNFSLAYSILQEKNIMSEICSIVCPVENQCMGNCIRNKKGNPVNINYLENYVNNWVEENKIEYQVKIENNIDKKVAIIGSGPAGLSCAFDLAKHGCKVTIFEKELTCGGLLNYGIPNFRLDKLKVKKVIEKVKRLGVQIKTGVNFGHDINIEDLKKAGYDNIFLAFGAEIQSTYKLTDKQTNNIYTSSEFLKKYNYNNFIPELGTTIIIGGGNVALDSARAAIRMGAKQVYILYRRNRELMPARQIEIEEAVADGVQIIFQTKVINASIENGKLMSIECIKTNIQDNSVIDIQNSNYTMKANTLIFAIGAKVNQELMDSIGVKTGNNLCAINEQYMTNIEDVYAGGDLVLNKPSVCKAIATGKKVAEIILKKESEKNVKTDSCNNRKT